MDAHGITATFNPLGVFLRRWQLDEVRIQGGEVAIQTYEPKPEPSPSKPWYHIFLPNRVYLQRVWSEPADVTWRFRNEKGGFFGTRLLITPHGRDFEYQANGGTMKLALIPDLPLRHTHLLITKKLLTLYTLELAAGTEDEGAIHGEGTAGTGEDKSVDFKLRFDKLPIREWLPASWKNHVAGAATGEVHWKGKNPKLETASVQGSLRVRGGRVRSLPFLQKLASITGKKSIEQLELNECSAEVHWESPTLEIRNIAIEDKGKFRIEGTGLSAREVVRRRAPARRDARIPRMAAAARRKSSRTSGAAISGPRCACRERSSSRSRTSVRASSRHCRNRPGTFSRWPSACSASG